MGFSLKKAFKSSINFNKNVFGGGYLRDALGGGGGGGNAAKVDYLSQQAREQAALNYARGQTEQQRSIGETRQAYTSARKSLGAGRTQGIQAVQDAGAQAGARAGQSMANRGLYNTTIMDNAQQGISSGVSRSIADIDAHYAQMLGQLGIQEQNTVNGIRQNIAGGAAQQGALQAGLYMNHAGLINSQVEEDPNAWLNSLFGIAGTAAGVYVGKNI